MWSCLEFLVDALTVRRCAIGAAYYRHSRSDRISSVWIRWSQLPAHLVRRCRNRIGRAGLDSNLLGSGTLCLYVSQSDIIAPAGSGLVGLQLQQTSPDSLLFPLDDQVGFDLPCGIYNDSAIDEAALIDKS
ncbi:hypothetical protein BDW67DRAFT_160794 [Aspergillus spinulosporus]